ncbi:hypothetical protein [Blastococcus sp. SYSU DS0539]
MTRFVIDAPTLLHLVAEGVAVAPGHQLVAPQVLRSQALDLLFAAVRRGELTERESLARHDAMTRVEIRSLGDRVSRQVARAIAREHDVESTTDAEYLAVTRLQPTSSSPWTRPRGRERRASSRWNGRPVAGAVIRSAAP